MDDRLRRVESAVSHLQQSIGDLEHRLAVIERAVVVAGAHDLDAGGSTPPPPPPPPAPPARPFLPARAKDDLGTTLSFVGRTFVALGGAYLLRALTDAGAVPLP